MVTSARDFRSSSPVEAHAVERAEAVRARERDDAVGVEAQQAVDWRGAHHDAGRPVRRGRGSRRSAIMPNRSFALAVKLSSWRLGVRISSWLECRVTTAMGRSVRLRRSSALEAAEHRDRRGRGSGCPRTSPARRSRRPRDAAKPSVTWLAPLLADLLPDDVAVEQRRRGARGRACATATNEPSSAVGTQSTMSAKDRSARSCQSPTSRWSHSTSASEERPCARTRSLRVDTRPV